MMRAFGQVICLEWMLSEKHSILIYLKQDEALYRTLKKDYFSTVLYYASSFERNIRWENKMKLFVFSVSGTTSLIKILKK